jgi:general secretion pathway protein G
MVGRPLARAGFTLIELLVVMALLGMLLALSVPRYFGHVDRARETLLRQDLAAMRDAIDKYYGDHARYPQSLDELVGQRYLRRIPVDPYTERSDSWVVAAPADTDTGAVFDVRSGAPGTGSNGMAYGEW